MPQLTSLQLLQALVLIENKGPLGRRVLAEALQINDGTVRGLLERLAEGGIVSVTGAGVRLSSKGGQQLGRLLRQLSVKKILDLDGSDLVTGNTAVGVHLSKSYDPRIRGIVQRDEAIKAGAEGCITVAVLKKTLVVPPDNKNMARFAPKANALLWHVFKPSNNDLIIIGFGRDSGQALAGALAGILSLRKR